MSVVYLFSVIVCMIAIFGSGLCHGRDVQILVDLGGCYRFLAGEAKGPIIAKEISKDRN